VVVSETVTMIVDMADATTTAAAEADTVEEADTVIATTTVDTTEAAAETVTITAHHPLATDVTTAMAVMRDAVVGVVVVTAAVATNVVTAEIVPSVLSVPQEAALLTLMASRLLHLLAAAMTMTGMLVAKVTDNQVYRS